MVEGDVIIKTLCGVIQESVDVKDQKSLRKGGAASSDAGDTSFRSNNLKTHKK